MLATQLAAVWAAHIGMDRVAGYGMKDGTGFKYTHLSVAPPAEGGLEEPFAPSAAD